MMGTPWGQGTYFDFECFLEHPKWSNYKCWQNCKMCPVCYAVYYYSAGTTHFHNSWPSGICPCTQAQKDLVPWRRIRLVNILDDDEDKATRACWLRFIPFKDYQDFMNELGVRYHRFK